MGYARFSVRIKPNQNQTKPHNVVCMVPSIARTLIPATKLVRTYAARQKALFSMTLRPLIHANE